ncbi:MAG: amidase [Nocardia sp.]|nr:amidase [Nocardia sp.]
MSIRDGSSRPASTGRTGTGTSGPGAGLSRRTLLCSAGLGLAAAGAARTVARAVPAGPRNPALPDPARITATDPAMLSALEAAALLQAKKLHPRELLAACTRRSAAYDGPINSWVHTYPAVAADLADRAAARLAAGGAPLMCGLPIALKNLFAVGGLPLTASSRVLEGNIAAGDATVWQRLRDSGAVLMGHVHTDEFAIGMVTPQVGNPWDTGASVGGSSGGSAAAVAARFSPLAVGTDTGGSIRVPASRAGISAIKPTFGQVSTFGLIPLSRSRDHVGFMGRSIAEAALLMSATAGPDPRDPSTLAAAPLPPLGPATRVPKPLAGKRFGVIRADVENLPGQLAALMDRFLRTVTALGGALIDVTMPEQTVTQAEQTLEMADYHRQFADRLPLYQPQHQTVLNMAFAVNSTPSTAADRAALEQKYIGFQLDYNRLLSERRLDAIIGPTVATDRDARTDIANTFLDPNSTYTIWADYTRAPVIALPIGRSADTGLPFGVELSGRIRGDADLIRLGIALQAAEPGWLEHPDLPAGPRTLPHTDRTAPGTGPDPTGTRVSDSPVRFGTTTALH